MKKYSPILLLIVGIALIVLCIGSWSGVLPKTLFTLTPSTISVIFILLIAFILGQILKWLSDRKK